MIVLFGSIFLIDSIVSQINSRFFWSEDGRNLFCFQKMVFIFEITMFLLDRPRSFSLNKGSFPQTSRGPWTFRVIFFNQLVFNQLAKIEFSLIQHSTPHQYKGTPNSFKHGASGHLWGSRVFPLQIARTSLFSVSVICSNKYKQSSQQ